MNRWVLTSDFSLVIGGPLSQLWRGTRLADDTLHLLHRRVRALVLLSWCVFDPGVARAVAQTVFPAPNFGF